MKTAKKSKDCNQPCVPEKKFNDHNLVPVNPLKQQFEPAGAEPVRQHFKMAGGQA